MKFLHAKIMSYRKLSLDVQFNFMTKHYLSIILELSFNNLNPFFSEKFLIQ